MGLPACVKCEKACRSRCGAPTTQNTFRVASSRCQPAPSTIAAASSTSRRMMHIHRGKRQAIAAGSGAAPHTRRAAQQAQPLQERTKQQRITYSEADRRLARARPLPAELGKRLATDGPPAGARAGAARLAGMQLGTAGPPWQGSSLACSPPGQTWRRRQVSRAALPLAGAGAALLLVALLPPGRLSSCLLPFS